MARTERPCGGSAFHGQLWLTPPAMDVILPLVMTAVMTPEQLKRRRARMGLTQSDLSKALGVALTTVGRWEIGQRRIPEMAVRLIYRLQRENRKREGREPRRG